MSRWPDNYMPLNGCRSCGLDFTSLAAFDRHLGGTPENRRPCRSVGELAEVGLAVLTPGELARSRRNAHRAQSGVVLVHDPERAEGVRRRFAERDEVLA